MKIERFAGGAKGRSRASATPELVFTVANARDTTAGFAAQVAETFAILDAFLLEAGSHRSRMLSVTVYLTDIGNRTAFDAQWCEWIGPDPQAWPQRAVVGAALAPGLLVELTVVAARGA